ncbi:MAG TPA: glycosyltransferase [Steroidobacteraceae bacterium]|jgi:hypothetical protein
MRAASVNTGNSVHLSLIIPTLNRVTTARLLGERVRSLLPGLNVETIVVTPAPEAGSDAGLHYVEDRRRGVYAAYNSGLRDARGEFVWFMGDDDYPLDGAAILADLLTNSDADVFVAPVVLSTGRIYRPKRSRLLLHFLNWCQQGVVYRRSLFERYRLYSRLKVQADQYVNVLLRCDPEVAIRFLPEPLCMFGVSGVSGQRLDGKYRALRLALAARTLGPIDLALFRALTLVEPVVKSWLGKVLTGRASVPIDRST